jgi:hypothetical protein
MSWGIRVDMLPLTDEFQSKLGYLRHRAATGE